MTNRSVGFQEGRLISCFQGDFARNGLSLAVRLPLLLLLLIAGCGESPPAAPDPAKAPWLYDPQSQIDNLEHDDYRIRGLAAFNLGNMGAAAAAALPQLEKLAQDDPNPKVRENALAAVEKIRAAQK